MSTFTFYLSRNFKEYFYFYLSNNPQILVPLLKYASWVISTTLDVNCGIWRIKVF